MRPTMANGKICYLDIPAADIARSAKFYQACFGWEISTRGDGSTTFNDSVGQVSGTWQLAQPAPDGPGIRIHIMVADMEQAMKAVVAHGGEIVEPVGKHLPEITAKFRDPGGNLLGLYQDQALWKSTQNV